MDSSRTAAAMAGTPLPTGGMTVFGTAAAVTFLAASAAPTPIYRLYEQDWGLSPAIVTVIFAVYAISLLFALLTVGKLSDYVGRRPMIFAALALNIVAMGIFIAADSAAALIVARVLQGFATGAATTALGAAILDANKTHGPLLDSVTPFAGLTVGTVLSSLLVAFAPLPTHLVYIVIAGVSVVLLFALLAIPETAARRPGALAALRPRVGIPAPARAVFLLIAPASIAAWALGGFYFSLMPSLVQLATGISSPLVGGGVVATLTLVATLMVVALRTRPARATLIAATLALALGVAITLAGVASGVVALMFLGTVVAGVGFGAGFSATLRLLLPLAPPTERAALLASYYVMSYLAFSLLAILVGEVAPAIGLVTATYIYGAAVIVLALISFVATASAREAAPA